MELKYEANLISLSKLLNLLLLIGFLSMTLVVVVLSLSLRWAMYHQERTIVPPDISQAFTISAKKVDAPYLNMMGEYFLNLKLNVTPKNISHQYGRLLDYVSAQTWASFQTNLLEEALYVQKNNIASRWEPLPNKSSVSLDSLSFKQEGHLVKSIGNRELPGEKVTFVVKMKYDNGMLSLHSIVKEGEDNEK